MPITVHTRIPPCHSEYLYSTMDVYFLIKFKPNSYPLILIVSLSRGVNEVCVCIDLDQLNEVLCITVV